MSACFYQPDVGTPTSGSHLSPRPSTESKGPRLNQSPGCRRADIALPSKFRAVPSGARHEEPRNLSGGVRLDWPPARTSPSSSNITPSIRIPGSPSGARHDEPRNLFRGVPGPNTNLLSRNFLRDSPLDLQLPTSSRLVYTELLGSSAWRPARTTRSCSTEYSGQPDPVPQNILA